MTVQLAIGLTILVVLAIAITIEIGRLRVTWRQQRRAAVAPARRMVHLEERMITAFGGPRDSYGELFAEFSIWNQMNSTRMDVRTKGEWRLLNTFTRSLIIRHLWQTLGSLVKGSPCVIVDIGEQHSMVWTAEEAQQFNDCGVVAPWTKKKGKVGTLTAGAKQ